MNRTINTFFAVIVNVGVCIAQSAPAASNPINQSDQPAIRSAQSSSQNQIPAGSVIVAELSKSVDAKKAKPGDKVEARTAMDLLSQGKIVIPRNTKILGQVVEARPHTKDSPGSALSITFDRIAMKDGREFQMQSRIQAIGRPLQPAVLSDRSPMSDASMSAASPSPTSEGLGAAATRTPASASSGSYPGGRMPSSTDTATSPQSGPAPLGPTSQGVVGIKGLQLKSDGTSSVISSDKDNVKLERGTQLMLRTQ